MGLVIDKLTGQIFLFDLSSSSGGTGGSGATYQQVNIYSQLPNPAAHNNQIYVVLQPSGVYMTGRKEAGMYYSNGVTWTRLGDIPSFFASNNFQVYDSANNTKIVKFQLSGLTSGTTTTVTMRNTNGTLAYLSDIGAKLDLVVFTAYTASTKSRFLGIDAEIAKLSGSTNTQNHAIQVIDLVGGINVNGIAPTAIQWTNVEFTGTSLSYTGASRIYIQATGQYEISYNLVLRNGDNTSKSIGSVIRVNGNIDVTPLSVSSYIDNGSSITGNNNLANYMKTLNAGDFLELTAFRISNGGTVNTIPGASWIRVIKN